VTTEPQYGCGAVTLGWHLRMEIKLEHATDCRLRRDPKGGKNEKNPLLGGVCLLTKGGLIRVRLGMVQLPVWTEILLNVE
jgi:hypothetical protein